MRRVLVTGGSGFVGAALVGNLLRRGHDVVATATAARAASSTAQSNARLRWVRWDAMHEPVPAVDWNTLDVIVHLAVPRAPFDFVRQANAIYEVTVAATYRILEAARTNGVRRVVAASTGDVLGANSRPAREDDCTYEPSSFYGTTKACAELLLRAYDNVLQTAALRLFHPYGPGGERFLVNRLVRAVSEGREVTIEGPDGILLDPVWIDDLAEGLCLAVESEATGILHFAGPETVTLRQLLGAAGELAGCQPVVRSVPREPVQRHQGTYERTERLLGYRPRVGVRDGIRQLLGAAT